MLQCSFKTKIRFVRDSGEPMRDLWLDDAPAASLASPQPQCSGVPYPSNATVSATWQCHVAVPRGT